MSNPNRTKPKPNPTGTLTWNQPGNEIRVPFTSGQTFVAKFTAGATTRATVTAAEYGSPPRLRQMKICLDAAGTQPIPRAAAKGNTVSVTISAVAGTTYYALINCVGGTLGANASMVIALSHP